jgi:hypothetical protein
MAAANFFNVNGYIIPTRAAVQSRSIGRRKCRSLRDFKRRCEWTLKELPEFFCFFFFKNIFSMQEIFIYGTLVITNSVSGCLEIMLRHLTLQF